MNDKHMHNAKFLVDQEFYWFFSNGLANKQKDINQIVSAFKKHN